MPNQRRESRTVTHAFRPASGASGNGAAGHEHLGSVETGADPSSEIADFLWMFWRRRYLMVVVIALVVGATLFYTSQQTKIYESSAEVLVRPVNLSPKEPPNGATINMEPEKRVVASAEVGQCAAGKTGRLAAPAGVSVSAPLNTNTLVVTSSSRVPAAAQKTAQARAECYLTARRNAVLDALESARQPLERQLLQVKNDVQRVQSQLVTAPTPAQQTLLGATLSGLLSRQGSLQSQLDELIAPENLNVGEVITNAVVPSSPARPNPRRAASLAAFVALGLAIALAMFRDRLDRRVRRTGDVAVGAQAPVLAVVPSVSALRNTQVRSITVGPESDYTRAFRTLRATVEFLASDEGIKSIVVTSPMPGDGKTCTVANLGAALARSGRRVVLVSADLRHQDLRAHFMTRGGLGLTNVLAGEHAVTDALKPVGDHLYLLDVGPDWPIAAELLGSPAMAALLDDLKRFADVVLVDSPSVLESADALAVAPLADTTLLVVDADTATITDITQARYLLEQVGAHVSGAVLNNVDRSRFRLSYGSTRGRAELPPAANWSA